MKKTAAIITAAATALCGINTFAAETGVCTHMAQNYAILSNLEAAEDMEMSWIRDECYWFAVETAKGTRVIPYNAYSYIKKAHENGLNQLLVLDFGNGIYDGGGNVVIPLQSNSEYYSAWLEYVRYTVGALKDYVEAYEIWNEPNHTPFNSDLSAATGTEYAKLYLDTRAIIKELDPSAKVICGSILNMDNWSSYASDIFSYIRTRGSVNDLLDAFSIHIYANSDYPEEEYSNILNDWEELFDTYGYTGDVWLTETGKTASDGVDETIQASYIARFCTLWENYLKTNNRGGRMFWYDLRNDVTGSDYEDNFGLTYSDYTPKPVYYAMQTYNRLTDGKSFVSYSTPRTYHKSGGWFHSDTDYYGVLAEYSDGTDKLYIAFDEAKGRGTDSISVPLSGDVAYIYDYSGNKTSTINNPSGTASLAPSVMPQYVECVTYYSDISQITYNGGIITVSGNSNLDGELTVELLDQSGTVVQTAKTEVRDKSYTRWFKVNAPGSYTVRVGQPELAALGKSNGWGTASYTVPQSASDAAPQIAAGTTSVYNAETRTVTVSGTVTNPVNDQNVTLMALPADENVVNPDTDSFAALVQKTAENGAFSFAFTLPEWYSGETAIYISGTDIETPAGSSVSIPDEAYAYVAGFDTQSTGNTVTATASVRNFAAEDKYITIIIAEYAGERFLDVAVEKLTIEAGTYSPVSVSKSKQLSDGVTQVHAFVWDDLYGLNPLSELVVVQ